MFIFFAFLVCRTNTFYIPRFHIRSFGEETEISVLSTFLE